MVPSFLHTTAWGALGYREVTYDVSTRRWQVSSPESVDLRPPLTIDEVARAMEDQAQLHKSIEEFADTLNRIMLAADPKASTAGNELEAESDFSGQTLLLRHHR